MVSVCHQAQQRNRLVLQRLTLRLQHIFSTHIFFHRVLMYTPCSDTSYHSLYKEFLNGQGRDHVLLNTQVLTAGDWGVPARGAAAQPSCP